MRSLASSQDQERLRQRLSSLKPADERHWGVMTAAQMVCHLRGAFRIAMGEIPCAPVSLLVPRPVLKPLALWVPIRWRRNFETVPALKVGARAMDAGAFDHDLEEALKDMESFVRLEQERVDHAFFGPMSYADWMRWGYLHTDHHLRQFGR